MSPISVNQAGTWRTAIRMYVRDATVTWRIVQRAFVNQAGTWRLGFARTPAVVTGTGLTLNGTTDASLTVSASPVAAVATWTRGADDAGLPVEVVWYVNGSPSGSPDNVQSGNTASRDFTIGPGQSRAIYATIRVRNGVLDSVDGGDVYGPVESTPELTRTWPQPTLTSFTLGTNVASNLLTAVWIASNAPSGAKYRLRWRAEYQDDPLNVNSRQDQFTNFTTNATGRNLDEFDHGYTIMENLADAYIRWYCRAQMYTADETTLLVETDEESLFVPVETL
jgi:hypothetical protein